MQYRKDIKIGVWKLMKKVILIVLGLILVCCVGSFLAAQVIPYGRGHQNPAVMKEPNWDSPQTRALAKRACFDCHSNETTWPWYSNIAPFSWLVQHDVEEGRGTLNFSEFGSGQDLNNLNISEAVQSGEMPPAIYLIQHPDSRLSQAEREQLQMGLQKTLGTNQ
jgi:hypothetical protein